MLLALAAPATAHADVGKDRAALVKRLGQQAVLDVDHATGTPRALGRLDGALAGPAAGSPEAIADGYVRSHLSALGLTQADLDTRLPADVTKVAGGISVVRWRQAVDGVPASDNELRVNVAPDGSVINVLGSPAHALSVDSTTPALSSGEAVREVQDATGSYRSLTRTQAGRKTTFSDGTLASLVLFEKRLAWRVMYRSSSTELWDATVDADSGRILRRVNMTKNALPANVWRNYPDGSAPITVDLAPTWLSPAATTLNGPNVYAESDVDDNNATVEDVAPVGGSYQFTMQTGSGTGCDATHVCSWNSAAPATRTQNRAQGTVQAFYFANVFHDHLKADPIDFDAAHGNFEGADKVVVQAFDGANFVPDQDHTNNANMSTPPDGFSPLMQMYLFRNPSHRNVSGTDSAAIVYHEYTHGLSNRLVTDADGFGALNSPQAGAMGEAWSDWYALDFLANDGLITRPDMGEYTDFPGGSGKIRSQPLDCPVAFVAAGCVKRGYTYADFGSVGDFGPEVHDDGEIWAETLWQIRSQPSIGSVKAETLITAGMAMLPAEPSFLDARNGILQADTALFGGADRAVLWSVFADRRMGFFAATTTGADIAPVPSTALPPDPNGPKGSIAGRVTSADTGLALGGITVGIGGFMTEGALPDTKFTTVSGGDGRYSLGGVPEGSYARLLFTAPGYDLRTDSVTVAGGGTATSDMAVSRNWASPAGGAQIVDSEGDDYPGCGPEKAIDGDSATGWSAVRPNGAPPNSVTIQLSQTIDISEFRMDPSENCGDDFRSAARDVQIETSPDGATWSTAATASFGDAERLRYNSVPAVAAAADVRFVRLTVFNTQGSSSFIDVTEFGVYGGPRNVLPSGTVSGAPNPVLPGTVVNLTAQMSDPDSLITGYEWDFGDGTTSVSSAPSVQHAFSRSGTFAVRASARDFRGGKGVSAPFAVSVQAVATATPTPTPTPPVKPVTFKLPSSGSKGAAALTVTCVAQCTATATLTADKATAKKLKLTTLGKAAKMGKGSLKFTVKLSSAARRALKKRHLKSVTVTLKVSVRSGGKTTTSSKRVKIRL
jgi:hypothetical protein